MNRWLVALVGLLGLLLASLLLFWHPENQATRNSAVNTPSGGEFTLQSANGPVSLKDFRGKVVLLYFGYTFCPDICPTSLAATAQGLKSLTADEAARVALIFISVDPERDTPVRLKEYAEFFHPNMLGVTGSPLVLAELAKRYGAFYARQPVETAGGGYVVDHSADTYIVGPSGQLRGKIPHAAPPEQVVAAIRQQFQ